MRTLIAAVAVLVVLPKCLAAQLPCSSSGGFSVHKTFDGSKSEKDPASFFWINAPTAKDKRYSLVDVAAKFIDIECDPGPTQLLLYPVAEYHSSNAASKPTDNGSIGANLEFRPVPITSAVVVPAFYATGKGTRDFRESLNGAKLSTTATLSSNTPGLPGSDIRPYASGFVRYYPYVGVERYQSGPVGADTAGTFGVARLWTEFSPYARGNIEVLQLTADWSGRKRWSGNVGPSVYVHDLDLSATLYLDSSGHIGIGAEYARGNDPQSGFVFREKTSIGVKVKY